MPQFYNWTKPPSRSLAFSRCPFVPDLRDETAFDEKLRVIAQAEV
jgi:hypothetical protein